MTRNNPRTSDDPAHDRRVRELLTAAAAPVETAGPLPGEDEALAAFRTSTQRTRRTSMLSPLVSTKAAVAAAISTGVLLTGGVGAAAAGVLPGPAQETASTVLETVGISVPAGHEGSENGPSGQTPGDRADGNRPSGQPGGEDAGENAEVPPAADHGKQVSDTAKNTTAEGADKGHEIAGVASDGRVKSGEHGPAGTPPGKPAGVGNGEPPVAVPNAGGTGTASGATSEHDHQQSAGAADHGTATADESSDGASSSGSGNRP